MIVAPRPPALSVAGPVGGQGELCRTILADLPEYFALSESNAAYARAADELTCFVGSVVVAGGAGERTDPGTAAETPRPAGLLVLKQTSEVAVELHLVCVLRAFHGVGLGGALVRAAEAHLRAQGMRWFHVKTLGPSEPDEGYARTRAFYLKMGFEALEEIPAIWGPENPCLILVKRL
ncbi:MAG TPA: GNAT family N-acetyltransferase [Thermoleophilia bacterium]|nr:GNAT family N-acetyltransferase [Thermoleophilia bacterium]